MTGSPWRRRLPRDRALRDCSHAERHQHFEEWPEPEHPVTDPNPLGLSPLTRLVCWAIEQLGWLYIAAELVRRAWRRWTEPEPLWRGRR